MGIWTINASPFHYEGGADPSSDISHGIRFTLSRRDGTTRTVHVEAADGATVRMTEWRALAEVKRHLRDTEPPRQILMDRDGAFRSVAD